MAYVSTVGLYGHPQLSGLTGFVATGYGGGSYGRSGGYSPPPAPVVLTLEQTAARNSADIEAGFLIVDDVFDDQVTPVVTHHDTSEASRRAAASAAAGARAEAAWKAKKRAEEAARLEAEADAGFYDNPVSVNVEEPAEAVLDVEEPVEETSNTWIYGLLAVAALGGVYLITRKK